MNATLLTVTKADKEMIAGEVRAELARQQVNAKTFAEQLEMPLNTLYKKLRAEKHFLTSDELARVRLALRMPADWPDHSPTLVRELSLAYGPDPTTAMWGEVPRRGHEGPGPKLPPDFCNRGWESAIVESTAHLPDIKPGDILTFATVDKPRHNYMHIMQTTEDPSDLEPWIIAYVDGETTLQALNPKATPPSPDNVALIGIVTGWFHPEPPGYTMRLNQTGLQWTGTTS